MSSSFWESLSLPIVSFLTAYELTIACSINKAFSKSCKLNIFWKEKLLQDFNYKDKQNNAILISFFYFLTIVCISHLCHKLPDSIQTDKINLQYNKLSKKLTLIIGKIPKNYSDWHFKTVLPLIRKNYGKNNVDIIKIKKINKTVEKYLNEINKEKFYLELIVEPGN